jgi:PadR family transcriptional regulator PadR
MRKPEFIDMKGMLSFHVMWILRQRRMCGDELIKELGKRRDDTPSPGTLYPALKNLKADGLVEANRDDKRMNYSITPKGIKDLDLAISYFKSVYGEILQKSGIVQTRSHSYMPELKKTSEKDDLGVDFI